MADLDIQRLLKDTPNITDEIASLLKELQKESLEKSMLLELSKNINSTLNLNNVLNLIFDYLNRVIPFDAAGIFLIDPTTNKLIPESIRGYDKEAVKKAHLKVGRGLTGVVAREGKGIICPDTSKDRLYVNVKNETQSAMLVPLFAKEKLIGVLNLESDRLNAFNQKDFQLLTAFANHAAIALDNARLHRELLKSRDLERDLIIARQIQEAILPKSLPQENGYEFASFNLPSKTVSGDLYDLVRLASGNIGVAIGDVSGKGTPAAILMASLFSTYKSLLHETLSVQETMASLNNLIYETTIADTYATFFYGELNPKTRDFIYTNAGHFPPVIIRKNGGLIELKQGGTVLGFIQNMPYTESKVQLIPGDIALFYTDGLIEAQNPNGDFFELNNVIEIIQDNSHLSAAELINKITSEIYQFSMINRVEDDLTLIVIKVNDNE
ncbi:SpoIIE family protein phosphatase [candidate division KSB1 bacterium]|nr:SpoIIE family protein phosphatase [candidate division KSB1 bacterium]